MHDAYIGGRSENNVNASCMTISGGRTKQLDIICCVTGFTSDFLSFVVVELIRFFHGAIHLPFSPRCEASTINLVQHQVPDILRHSGSDPTNFAMDRRYCCRPFRLGSKFQVQLALILVGGMTSGIRYCADSKQIIN